MSIAVTFCFLIFFIALTVLYLMRIAYPFSYLFFMTQQELMEEEALLICWMRKNACRLRK